MALEPIRTSTSPVEKPFKAGFVLAGVKADLPAILPERIVEQSAMP